MLDLVEVVALLELDDNLFAPPKRVLTLLFSPGPNPVPAPVLASLLFPFRKVKLPKTAAVES